MNTFLTCAVALLVILIILNSPIALWAYRQKRIAKARYELTKVVTELQPFMKDGTLSTGEFIHDVVYPVIFYSQFLDRYITLRTIYDVLVSRVDSESNNVSEVLKEELKQKPNQIPHLVFRATSSFAKAAKYTHPIYYLLLRLSFAINGLNQSKKFNQQEIKNQRSLVIVSTRKPEVLCEYQHSKFAHV